MGAQNVGWREMARFRWRQLWFWASVWGFVIGPGLTGLVTIFLQVMWWLQFGIWRPRSVLWLLSELPVAESWANAPNSWLGLWRLVSWLPLSATALIVSFIAAAVMVLNGWDEPAAPGAR
jgi:hypothetical protein